jgi:transketolase
MRTEFGKFMSEIAEKDDKVVLIVGDIGYRIFDDFRKKFPERFFNFGICEQSIIGAAAGMAIQGLKPYVFTITPFLIERPFEQIKLDINEQKVNVKLVGFADYPNLGPSHAELDAKYMMKLFKNIDSYFPIDGNETREALLISYKSNKPAFISLKKDPLKK